LVALLVLPAGQALAQTGGSKHIVARILAKRWATCSGSPSWSISAAAPAAISAPMRSRDPGRTALL
jgi:hypothetical protein